MAVPGGSLLTEEERLLEAELQTELVCICGSCSHLQLSVCTCGTSDNMRSQLHEQVAQGKNREGVYQYFIDTYGSQEPLGAPIGAFNQLAWMFPLAVGGSFLIGIGVVAIRWSRRYSKGQTVSGAATSSDGELEARLDNELRNLD